jgi:hypothetical protein
VITEHLINIQYQEASLIRLKKTTLGLCMENFIHNLCRIDDKEFIILNLEVPLTCKNPFPEESIGAITTLNMGYKQYMQSIYFYNKAKI